MSAVLIKFDKLGGNANVTVEEKSTENKGGDNVGL
jgi:hypothetical protein